MDSISLSSVALASAATVAAGAYLNAKFSIGRDVQTIRGMNLWRKIFVQRLQQLGDTCTLYRMFDLVDEGNDALWFEGRSWTYGELKKGMFSSWLSDRVQTTNSIRCRPRRRAGK
jgi:hypothetical protein